MPNSRRSPRAFMPPAAIVLFLAIATSFLFASSAAEAQNRSPAKPATPAAKQDAPKADQPAPAPEEPPPPYEPQLLRLSEILGALTYLRDICGAADAETWRGRMQALLDAEAKSTVRKEHLAGAYNRGFHGYEMSYRVCTPNAKLVIERFLAEGEKITRDVTNRYSSS